MFISVIGHSADRPVKVGHNVDPASRCAELQTGKPERLTERFQVECEDIAAAVDTAVCVALPERATDPTRLTGWFPRRRSGGGARSWCSWERWKPTRPTRSTKRTSGRRRRLDATGAFPARSPYTIGSSGDRPTASGPCSAGSSHHASPRLEGACRLQAGDGRGTGARRPRLRWAAVSNE